MNPVWIFTFIVAVFSTLNLSSKAQDIEKIKDTELADIKRRSLAILADVVPQSKNTSSFSVLELNDGTVRWGNLFNKNEVVALVNLKPRPKDNFFDFPPSHLSFLIWDQSQWRFHQYLGNADHVEIHHRKASPAHIVTGFSQVERYGAEYSSWEYSPATKNLVSTNWTENGPAYITGDHLCFTRGLERLAHDSTTWIYQYKSGKQGDLLACLDQNDRGSFAVSFREVRSGKLKLWKFTPEENEFLSKFFVSVSQDNPEGKSENATEIVFLDNGEIDKAEYCFQLLTGLSPALLKSEWKDNLPPTKPLKRIAITASGLPEVVEKIEWPRSTSK